MTQPSMTNFAEKEDVFRPLFSWTLATRLPMPTRWSSDFGRLNIKPDGIHARHPVFYVIPCMDERPINT
jgi:hypothetical protein